MIFDNGKTRIVQLGSGDVVVGEGVNKEGVSCGIWFSDQHGKREIGSTVEPLAGMPIEGANAGVILEFVDPRSALIVLETLTACLVSMSGMSTRP